MAGQLPQLRAAGQHADEPATGRGRQRVLGVRRERQPADDGAGDAERAKCGGRSAGRGSAVGSCSTCRRCSSTNATPRPTGTATGSGAIRPPAPTRRSRRSSAVSVPISSDAPMPVTANRQPDLAQRSAQHRLARPLGQRRPNARGRAGSAARSAARVSLRCRRASSAPRGRSGRRQLGGRGLQRVLGPDGQQVVQPRREAGDHPLVERAPRRQRAGEGPGHHRRGDHQADADAGRRAGVVRPSAQPHGKPSRWVTATAVTDGVSRAGSGPSAPRTRRR